MKINKTASGNYHFQKMINGTRYSFTLDHKPTQKEIKQLIDEKEKLNSRITSHNAQNATFYECAIKYLDIKKNVISPSTARSYGAMLRSMPESFTGLKLKDIDQLEIQKLINDIAAERAPKTVRNYHAFISAVLQLYAPGLTLNTTLPQKIKNEDYIPTADEVKAVLKIAENTKYWVPFYLGAYGLRRSEILALTLDDINFETGEIIINKAMVYNDQHEWIIKQNKTTESSRAIIVSPEVLERIKRQNNVYTGHPRKIIENLHSMQKKAGVPQFKFHALRHFFATEISRVLPEADWLHLGGWSSPYVAKKIYRHSRAEQETAEKKKAATQLTNLLQ